MMHESDDDEVQEFQYIFVVSCQTAIEKGMKSVFLLSITKLPNWEHGWRQQMVLKISGVKKKRKQTNHNIF